MRILLLLFDSGRPSELGLSRLLFRSSELVGNSLAKVGDWIIRNLARMGLVWGARKMRDWRNADEALPLTAS